MGVSYKPTDGSIACLHMQMYYLPSIPLLALSSMVDERLDDTFGEQTSVSQLADMHQSR